MSTSVGQICLDLFLNKKAFEKEVNGLGTLTQNVFAKSFKTVGKLLGGAILGKGIVDFTNKCLDLGSSLEETQNVVDVTFPHMNKQVDNFAKNAINQFGLSEKIAKQYAGTFGAMSKSFGFSEKSAYDMGTALTGLAGDVASFYNIDPTEAYTKLKSVFTGETESLKDLGIVMTQTNLDQFALANGFGKVTANMTEQEKVTLRLAFVQKQLNAASGDFSRTSGSWANQVRILTLNFESFKATIGQGFINLFTPIVKWINILLGKLQTLANYFLAFTRLISGKKASKGVADIGKSISDASQGANNLANNVGGIGDNAKKAVKQLGSLAGFDEITNISPQQSAEGNGGEVAGGANVDFGSLDQFSEAPEIDTSKMEKSISFLKNQIKDFVDFFSTNKATIVSIITGIVTSFGVLKGIKAFDTLRTSLIPLISSTGEWQLGLWKTVQVLSGFSGPILLTVGAIGAITGSLVYLYQTNKKFRDLVNETIGNLVNILTGLWTTVLQPLFSLLGDMFKTIVIPLAEFILKVIVKNVEVLFTALFSFWNNVLAPIAKFLVDVLAIAVEGIIDVWEAWKPLIEELFKKLNWIWDEVLSPLADYVAGVFTSTFEEWGKVIDELIPSVTGMFQGLVDFFVGIFTGDIDKAWKGITDIFKNFDKFLVGVFSTDWSNSFDGLGNVLNTFFDYASIIWDGIKNIFKGIIKFVTGVFTSDWKKAWNGVKDIFGGIFDMLSGLVKQPLNAVISIINDAIDGINGIGFDVPDWVPWIGGESFRVNVPHIPMLANGGYVKANTPQLAMIGDNRHQGEVVAPEDKLLESNLKALEIFMKSKSNGVTDAQVIVSLLYDILDAIKNLRLIIDGDALKEDKDIRDLQEALRTGKLLLD